MKRLVHHVTVALIALCLALTGTLPAGIASAGPDEVCPGLATQMVALKQRIATHNATPHHFILPAQAAQSAAYDAEAAELETEKSALLGKITACTAAADAVATATPGGAPVETRAPEKTRSQLEEAKKLIPPNWRSPPVNRTSTGKAEVPTSSPVRPIYDALRIVTPKKPRDFGDVILQNQPKPKIGDPNPAYPGEKIGRSRGGLAAVSPDHIVPLAELVQLRDFWRLPPDQMYLLATTPRNFQWLPSGPNQSKRSGSAAAVNPPPDPQWAKGQVKLEDEMRSILQEAIDKLVKANE